MLVAITRAFDVEAIDRLLFLESCKKDLLYVVQPARSLSG